MFLAREDELNRFEVRIDEQEKGFVANGFALEIDYVGGIAAEQHSEAAHKWRRPFLLAHFVAARVEPHDVANLRPVNATPLQKFRAPKDRMIFAQFNQSPGELE